jgi:hypothetical protein
MAEKQRDESTAYQFKRATSGGIIDVVNSHGYLMAQYNDQTGKVSWQRMLPITQRESIEKRLRERYPVAAPKRPQVRKK